MDAEARGPLSPDGLHNFRDIGGVPLTNGERVPEGVLMRSDALGTLTPHGVQQIAESNVSTIVDMRAAAELQMAPDPTWGGIRYLNIPLLDGLLADLAEQAMTEGNPMAALQAAQSMLQQLPSLSELYVRMLSASHASFVTIVQEFASADGAVILHCTAGKDRTGLATALLLDVAGVTREAIISDYADSERLLEPHWKPQMMERVHALGLPVTPQIDELLAGSPAWALTDAFAWLDETYGSPRGYLRAAGASDEVLDQAARRLNPAL